jgi:hypothetical protein
VLICYGRHRTLIQHEDGNPGGLDSKSAPFSVTLSGGHMAVPCCACFLSRMLDIASREVV